MKGICGRLLEVDLTSGTTKDMAISQDLFEKYLGEGDWERGCSMISFRQKRIPFLRKT